MSRQRNSERGSAMLVTLIIVAALLAGVAVIVSMQLTATKSTELTRSGLAALHCAESGLAIARTEIGSNRANVNTHLGGYPASATIQPAFLTTFMGETTPARNDLDGDGSADFVIYIVDNDDDADYTTDSDRRIWLIARCIKYADTPKEVRELAEFPSASGLYRNQEGGYTGAGNWNPF